MRHPIRSMLLLSMVAVPMAAQEPSEGYHTVDGDQIHYLDFGGEGLPLVFIHGADRGAVTWAEFAPAFVDAHRVVAVTARGVAPSEGVPQPPATRVTDILSVLDMLGLSSAVFIGNSSPGLDMVELAAEHPERVAGLVFLAGAPPVASQFESDPTGGFAMAIAATQPPIRFPDAPVYIEQPELRFDSPALTFVTPQGTRGMERQPFPLVVDAQVREIGADWIQDAEAREFFERMRDDDELRSEVARAWEASVVPAILANEQAFWDAFGSGLSKIEIPVPAVTGYEYLNAPNLIEPHIREFAASLSR